LEEKNDGWRRNREIHLKNRNGAEILIRTFNLTIALYIIFSLAFGVVSFEIKTHSKGALRCRSSDEKYR